MSISPLSRGAAGGAGAAATFSPDVADKIPFNALGLSHASLYTSVGHAPAGKLLPDAADTARLKGLGYTPATIYKSVKTFLNSSSEAFLSLGEGRTLTSRGGVISGGFEAQDTSFLFKKALEFADPEMPKEKGKLVFKMLQACETLGVDAAEIHELQEHATVKIKEAPSEDGCSQEKEYLFLSTLLENSPVIKNMLSGRFFAACDAILLPEGYKIACFILYAQMSLNPDYDFSSEEFSQLLDMVPLADYFGDEKLLKRLDEAIKARSSITLDDAHYFFEAIEKYPVLEQHASLIINALIKNAIHKNESLDKLILDLHALDEAGWLEEHTLELDLLGPKVDNSILESLKSLKITRLNIAYSAVTRLPDLWLDSIHSLSISDSRLAVLQRLPHLKHLVALSEKGRSLDITSLTDNVNLETLEISILADSLPTGLVGLKKLAAHNCPHLSHLVALEVCSELTEIHLINLANFQHFPERLSRLKKVFIENCTRLKNLDSLNEHRELEEMQLIGVSFLERFPFGLQELTKLILDGSCVSLDNLDALNDLEHLAELTLKGLAALKKLPKGLIGLQILAVDTCPEIKNLDPLSVCKDLKELNLLLLEALEEVPLGLTGLQKLWISSCRIFKNLDALIECLELVEIGLANLPALQKLSHGLVALRKLEIEFCSRIENLDPLNGCPSLTEITLNGLEALLRVPAGLKKLKTFEANNCISLEDLDPLSGCVELEELKLVSLINLVTLPYGLEGLVMLVVESCRELVTLDHLSGCKKLQGILLSGLKKLKKIASGLEGLITFAAEDCPRLELDRLNGCTSLEKMILTQLNITKIPSGLNGLFSIAVEDCPRITDLDPLSICRELEEITLRRLLLLKKIPLGLEGLLKIALEECPGIEDLDPLSACRKLREIALRRLLLLRRFPSTLPGKKSISQCPLLT